MPNTQNPQEEPAAGFVEGSGGVHEPAGHVQFAGEAPLQAESLPNQAPVAKAPPNVEPPKKPQPVPSTKPGPRGMKPSHPHPPQAKRGPWILGRVYGAVLALAVVALIATFYFVPRQETASAYAPVFEQAGEIAVADRFPAEEETPAMEVPAAAQPPSAGAAPAAEEGSVEPVKSVQPPSKASKPPDFDRSLSLVLVGVPDVGMRSSHTLEAPVLSPKLKKGEKVAVLKRYAPATGPTWIKVQTRNGKTGWVFASVLQEKKSKGK